MMVSRDSEIVLLQLSLALNIPMGPMCPPGAPAFLEHTLRAHKTMMTAIGATLACTARRAHTVSIDIISEIGIWACRAVCVPIPTGASFRLLATHTTLGHV